MSLAEIPSELGHHRNRSMPPFLIFATATNAATSAPIAPPKKKTLTTTTTTTATHAQLEDMHAMLNNVSAERDAALNDLRRAGGVSASDQFGSSGGDADSKDEVRRLRRDCDKLRDQVSRQSLSFLFLFLFLFVWLLFLGGTCGSRSFFRIVFFGVGSIMYVVFELGLTVVRLNPRVRFFLRGGFELHLHFHLGDRRGDRSKPGSPIERYASLLTKNNQPTREEQHSFLTSCRSARRTGLCPLVPFLVALRVISIDFVCFMRLSLSCLCLSLTCL